MDDEDDFPWDEVELPAGYASQRVAPPQTEPAPAPQRPLALVGGSTWQHHGEYMDVKKGKLYEQDQQNAAVLGGAPACTRLCGHTALTLTPTCRSTTGPKATSSPACTS